MRWYSLERDARDSGANLDCCRCWCSVINERQAVSAMTVAASRSHSHRPCLILIDASLYVSTAVGGRLISSSPCPVSAPVSVLANQSLRQYSRAGGLHGGWSFRLCLSLLSSRVIGPSPAFSRRRLAAGSWSLVRRFTCPEVHLT